MTKQNKHQFEKEKILDRRIGIRLNSVHWPLDFNTIDDILRKLNYTNITRDPDQSHHAVKHNTVFYTDRMKMVFGFHNRDITSLIGAQVEFFSTLNREYKIDLSNYVRFYEVECVSNIITERETFDVFTKISQNFAIKNSVENILGTSLRLNSLELSSPNSGNNDQWEFIEVSPRIESNGKIYFCRLVSRGSDAKHPYEILRKSSDTFEQIITLLENQN